MARIKAFPRQLIVVQKPSLATQVKSWLFLLLLLLLLLFVCLLFFFCGLTWFGFLLLERFSYDQENGFGKYFLFVFSANGLFVFPPKKTLIWRRHCLIGQSCFSMTSKQSID